MIVSGGIALHALLEMPLGQELYAILMQIRNAEDSIKSSLYRVDVLEKKLKEKHMTEEERVTLEKELDDMKKQLAHNESDLKGLYKENSKSFALAAILIFVIFLLYGIYVLIVGPP